MSVDTTTKGSSSWVILAGISALLMLGCAVFGVVVTGHPADGWPLLLVGWPLVGGVVVARRRDNRVARVLIAYAVWFALSQATELYVHAAQDGLVPAIDFVTWLTVWIFPLTLVILVYLVAVFPTGEIGSPWIRRAVVAMAVVMLVHMGLRMVLPVDAVSGTIEGLINPWAIDGMEGWLPVSDWTATSGLLLLCVIIVDLVRRWVRSTGTERMQMRWLSWTLIVFAVALAVTTTMMLAGASAGVMEVADTVAWVSFLGVLPFSIGGAITRHRLYEIDRLISRTVSYSLVIGLLAAVFAAAVAVLSSALPNQSDLAITASTLALATLFNPLRARVQTRVDRRFNRSRFDAQQEVAALVARLRDAHDLDEITTETLAVVSRTMQPESLSMWVDERA